MRMLDPHAQRPLSTLQLYLSVAEAQQLRAHLDVLLATPEANTHEHLTSDDGTTELSLSIVTPTKLREGGYTKLERHLLGR